MATFFAGKDAGEEVLLHETCKTILQMANTARCIAPDNESKSGFIHLALHCYRISPYLPLAGRTSSQRSKKLVEHALHLLSCLISDAVHPTLLPNNRLAELNRAWSNMKNRDDDNLDFIRKWLKLGQAQVEGRVVHEALDDFADSIENQFSEQKFEGSTKFVQISSAGDRSKAVQKAAKSTFNALLNRIACSCVAQHDYMARLRLGTYRKRKREIDDRIIVEPPRIRRKKSHGNDSAGGRLVLDMFISMEQHWQEVCVIAEEEKRVKFSEPTELDPEINHLNEEGATKIDRLCEPLTTMTKLTSRRLVLKLISGELVLLGHEATGFPIATTASDTSDTLTLSRCLEECPDFFYSHRKRGIISLFVGYAVLNLTGTPWLQPDWDSADIRFFQILQANIKRTPLRPYIQIQLPSVTSSAVDGSVPDGESSHMKNLDEKHLCPELMGLAITLMEVQSALSFGKLAKKYHVDLSDPVTMNDTFEVFFGIQGTKEGYIDDIGKESALGEAIGNCLTESLWEDDQGLPLKGSSLRSRIYQEVIQRLEEHLTQACPNMTSDVLDEKAAELDLGAWDPAITTPESNSPSDFTDSDTPKSTPTQTFTVSSDSVQARSRALGSGDETLIRQDPQLRSQISKSAQGRDLMSRSGTDFNELKVSDDVIFDEASSKGQAKSYEMWKKRYREVYDTFIEESPLHHPVKIAILDTGIDRDHYVIHASDSLKGTHNYCGDSQEDVADLNGHGTFAASLILDYAPDVELYVIKVVDRENASPDGEIIAKAITFAVDKWNVDIISMSFGWASSPRTGHEAIQRAIDVAHSKQVLMFAAASNNGGRTGRAYPASRREVICVHSTNTRADRSAFSPTAQTHALNFATVGEMVQSAWPVELCHDKSHPFRIKSGTSYATPIMAGIAAFLLQFVRLHLPELASALKRRENMENILKRCHSRGYDGPLRDGYFNVELSFHHENLFAGGLEAVKARFLDILRTN